MPSLPLSSLALLAALAAGAALGYKWRDNTANLAQAQWQRDYHAAMSQAQATARQREQHLSAQMEAIAHDAQRQLETLESRLASERRNADTRVRDLAREYASRRAAGTDSAAATSCQAAESRARMLADLLAELDQLAGQFASESDRRLIAGKACERAYQAAKTAPK